MQCNYFFCEPVIIFLYICLLSVRSENMVAVERAVWPYYITLETEHRCLLGVHLPLIDLQTRGVWLPATGQNDDVLRNGTEWYYQRETRYPPSWHS